MDFKADILFKDVVADTDPEDVAYRLQCCVNEWFFPEVTKTMPEVHVSVAPPVAPIRFKPFPESPPEPPIRFDIPDRTRTPSMERLVTRLQHGDHLPQPKPEKPARDIKPFPIYVVSDLHLGDGGPRDNFAHMADGRREDEFLCFLDFVEGLYGRLIIVGDLFELWQSNISLVLTYRDLLLNRLAKMGAIYVLGNHDADLLYFCSEHHCPWLGHPFFKTMRTEHTERMGDKFFHFIHGHEVDHYCAGDNPGLGRISAIYSGLREDRNGSPLLNKYQTVEAKSIGRLERLSNFIRWCLGKPSRTRVMNRALCEYLNKYEGEYDVLVSGHTHRAGQLVSKEKGCLPGRLPIFNAGTWAESVCSFVAINPDGNVGVFDWINGQPEPNSTLIEV